VLVDGFGFGARDRERTGDRSRAGRLVDVLRLRAGDLLLFARDEDLVMRLGD
jgi:hypothetical protein